MGARPNRNGISIGGSNRTHFSWTTAPGRWWASAIIGNHVKMYQASGLVARSLAAGQAVARPETSSDYRDRVTVYAGATIIGGDTVDREGSTIGAQRLPAPPASRRIHWSSWRRRILKLMSKKVARKLGAGLSDLTGVPARTEAVSSDRQRPSFYEDGLQPLGLQGGAEV